MVKKNIQITLTREILEDTKVYCDKNGFTKSGLINMLLKQYLEARKDEDTNVWKTPL